MKIDRVAFAKGVTDLLTLAPFRKLLSRLQKRRTYTEQEKAEIRMKAKARI